MFSTDAAQPVALAHDYLLVMRGAERTFAAMADVWPQAPIYTLLYDERGTGGHFADRRIHPSPLQALRLRQGSFRTLLPLYPPAVALLPTRRHDVVVSSSSAFAHGVRVGDGVHVSYCHSPFRYAWHERDVALEEAPRHMRPALSALLGRIRRWDRRVAQSVTHLVANSETTRRRIQEFWHRDANVVHPPVAVERFAIGEPEDFFLVVGELVRHKRVELAVRAAERAGLPIKVVGTGPDLPRLEARYGGRAEFLGRVDDAELARLYGRARAVVVPTCEEFGITAVEAQAAGRPVVAAGGGGQLETVVDGETGVFFAPDDGDALAEALRHTDFDRFSPARIKAHAQRFSTERFQHGLRREVATAVAVAC